MMFHVVPGLHSTNTFGHIMVNNRRTKSLPIVINIGAIACSSSIDDIAPPAKINVPGLKYICI